MRAATAAGCLLVFAVAGSPAAATVPQPFTPDLVQEPPDQLAVYRSGGRWVLRFGATVVNRGAGPLVITGSRTGPRRMTATQIVQSAEGDPLRFQGAGTFRFRRAGGHGHWHLVDFDRFELLGPNGQRVRPGRKTGFCVGDEIDRRRGDPGEAPAPTTGNVCGFRDPGRTSLLETLSVGFGQRYSPSLAGQYVVLSGLAAGRYVLRHTANPERDFLELNYANNAAAATFTLAWPRGVRERPRVRVTGRSRGLPLGVRRYRRAGDYLDYAARPKTLRWPSASRAQRSVHRRRGVRVVTEEPVIETYSAVEDAVYGLWFFTRWERGGHRRDLREAQQAAAWLARKQGADGTFRYFYEFNLGGTPPLVLRPGWHGAIGQGLAMSLWSRLYRQTRRSAYLRRARLAMRPLLRSMGEHGQSTTFLDTGLPWFEGYATLPIKVHTLGHFLPAVLGLYDMADLSPAARRLFQRAIRTVPVALPQFDLGDRTTPWLAHLTAPTRPVQITSGMFQEHFVAELDALDSIRPNAVVRRYRDRWKRQLGDICTDAEELCLLPHDAAGQRSSG